MKKLTTILLWEYSFFMNTLKLYHGSEKIIQKPKYGVGKIYNDYGQCFYCTQSVDMAKEWAVDINRDGYVNFYDLDLSGLSMLDLSESKYTVINWLAILIANRNFDCQTDFGKEAKEYLLANYLPAIDNFDVIKGYRADDSYFSFAQDFLNNTISVSTLSKAMNLGVLGEQIAIKSKKAFEQIRYVGNEAVDSRQWYPKKLNRDSKARSDYKLMRNEPWKRGEIYMMQILEQEIKEDDARLRPDIII